MAAVFLKILKMDFLAKSTFKIFYFFFGGSSIIWTTYSPSLASGKQFLPIGKNIFRKKIKIVNFFKNYRKKEKIKKGVAFLYLNIHKKVPTKSIFVKSHISSLIKIEDPFKNYLGIVFFFII